MRAEGPRLNSSTPAADPQFKIDASATLDCFNKQSTYHASGYCFGFSNAVGAVPNMLSSTTNTFGKSSPYVAT